MRFETSRSDACPGSFSTRRSRRTRKRRRSAASRTCRRRRFRRARVLDLHVPNAPRSCRRFRDKAGAGAGRPVSGKVSAARRCPRHSEGVRQTGRPSRAGTGAAGRVDRHITCDGHHAIRSHLARFCRTATAHGSIGSSRKTDRIGCVRRSQAHRTSQSLHAVAIVRPGSKPEVVLRELQEPARSCQDRRDHRGLNRAKRQFALTSSAETPSGRGCIWRTRS